MTINAQPHTEPEGCEFCEHGWRTVWYWKGERRYQGIAFCNCPAGRDCERTWRHVEEHNEHSRHSRGTTNESETA